VYVKYYQSEPDKAILKYCLCQLPV